MALHHILLLNFAAMAVLMVFLTVAYYVLPTREHRIHPGPRKGPDERKRLAIIGKNLSTSALVMAGFSYAASPWLLVGTGTSIVGALVDAFMILAIYDLGYYLMHRFAFHQWSQLLKVHAVHHTIKHPAAIDSLYLHPVELAMGVALLVASGLFWGPVTLFTWGVTITVYSALNLLIHSGLELPWRGWGPANFMARKHAVHHEGMQRGNYASISPVFDILFGTSES
jgi:sterol desaturase/sphingolipid hydroxylase (fatty acid hydroxylase superfamily)